MKLTQNVSGAGSARTPVFSRYLSISHCFGFSCILINNVIITLNFTEINWFNTQGILKTLGNDRHAVAHPLRHYHQCRLERFADSFERFADAHAASACDFLFVRPWALLKFFFFSTLSWNWTGTNLLLSRDFHSCSCEMKSKVGKIKYRDIFLTNKS